MNRLHYLWLKLSAMGCLVLGRGRRALEIFSQMLRLWPGDAYALASRQSSQPYCPTSGETPAGDRISRTVYRSAAVAGELAKTPASCARQTPGPDF